MRVLYVSRGYTTHDRRFLAQIVRRHEVHFLRCERQPLFDAYERVRRTVGERIVG